jgi:hypothetical protein
MGDTYTIDQQYDVATLSSGSNSSIHELEKLLSNCKIATSSQYTHPPKETVNKLLKETILTPNVEISNIHFQVQSKKRIVHIYSREWSSLSSSGASYHEAFLNMVSLLNDLIVEYVFTPEEKLTADAVDFRNFLLRKIF